MKQFIIGGVVGVTTGLLVYVIAAAQHVHPLGGWPLNIAFAATVAMCATRLYVALRREGHYQERLRERYSRGIEYDLWGALRDEESQVALRLMVERRSQRAAE